MLANGLRLLLFATGEHTSSGPRLLRSELHCRLGGGSQGAPAPAPDSAGMAVVQELGEAVHAQVQAYIAAMEARKIREGSRLAMAVSSIGEGFTCSWSDVWHTLGVVQSTDISVAASSPSQG